MLDFVIREAVPKDAAALAVVVRTAYRALGERFGLTPENCPTHPSFCTQKSIEDDMARHVRYFVLEVDKRVCGCAGVERVSSELFFLTKVGVLPGYRRRGFGTLLIERALEEAQTFNALVVRVALVADQAATIRWYKKTGFIEMKTEREPNAPFAVTYLEKSFRESPADESVETAESIE
ncbi:GNAT family N-acetyltransferase [Candidatus Sumerlaeota bacterium]|nr:GNAT family N-acetyltransferase [Candidatus Sumerlaeota bacterium]